MMERTQLVRAQRAIEAEHQTILGILVLLEVGGRESLLLRLGADGSIHRQGSGSIETMERDRFIGTLEPESFQHLVSRVSPELLAWCGQSRSHPAPRGELCELIVAFKQADGRELHMAWRYGSHSKWPPQEVLDFVDEAVRTTEPWYEGQKTQLLERTRRAEYDWWPFFTFPSA